MVEPIAIRIRGETAADGPAIHEVTRAAFLHAPHTAHTEHFIVDALRRAGALSVSLVAEEPTTRRIVGHVAVSPVVIADGTTGWFGLGPISVIPELQARRVGSRLMDAALQSLRGQGAAGCVLVGDPGYYSRFGFKAMPGLTLAGVPAEYLLSLPFGAAPPRGEVTFHAAFQARD